MRPMIMMLSVAALMVALTATAAFAATKYGTASGDGLYGTPQADKIYGFGGADLIYGYGGTDTLHGGNEPGWGDKILGGGANDRVLGQGGDDALYGQDGDDTVKGGAGNDLIVGGFGRDTLSGGGSEADEIDARDGQADTVVLCNSGPDTVYYDKGLDALMGCEFPQASAAMSSEEASEAGEVKLLAKEPPEGLFENTGKVLVEHEGKELLVAQKALAGHLAHGDELLDPTGRAAEKK